MNNALDHLNAIFCPIAAACCAGYAANLAAGCAVYFAIMAIQATIYHARVAPARSIERTT